MKKTTSEIVTSPFTVVIDTREQTPYMFADLRCDQREGGGPLSVLIARAGLDTGDYSVVGYEKIVAIERKSLADLFHTLGQDRERFERELERLSSYETARVLVEAEWSEILNSPPQHSQLLPKTVWRSVIAWQERYPRIHWLMVPGRAFGEMAVYRILERAWKERERKRR